MTTSVKKKNVFLDEDSILIGQALRKTMPLLRRTATASWEPIIVMRGLLSGATMSLGITLHMPNLFNA